MLDKTAGDEQASGDAPVKRGRGRPPGSKNKPKDVPASDRAVSAEDNAPAAPAKRKPGRPPASKGPTVQSPSVSKNPLTDEQEHALTQHHATVYENKLKAKKEADAAFKNACKVAKAEGVSLKQIKEYISYQTEEGQQKLREDLARKQKVARWAGIPIGTQLNFLEEIDRTPIDERMKEDGKRAGLKGEQGKPPNHCPPNLYSAWMEGWHDGQRILADRIKQKHEEQRAEDAKAFDDSLDPPEGGAEEEEEGEDETDGAAEE